MKKVKKYTQEKVNPALEESLNAYSSGVKAYRKVMKKGAKTLAVGSLASLAPLAASAQCGGPLTGTIWLINGNLTAPGSLPIYLPNPPGTNTATGNPPGTGYSNIGSFPAFPVGVYLPFNYAGTTGSAIIRLGDRRLNTGTAYSNWFYFNIQQAAPNPPGTNTLTGNPAGTAPNPAVVGNSTGSFFNYAINASSSFTSVPPQPPAPPAGVSWPLLWSSFNSVSYGNFGPGDGNTGFVPISIGGQLGFVEITVTFVDTDGDGIAETGAFIIGNYGVEDGQPGAGSDGVVSPGDCSSLPVELTSFTATANKRNIALEWTTASEMDNRGFEIQRSADGVNFNKIGFLAGQGASEEEVSYAHVDNNVKSNVKYYYRLKQMDFDGQYEYSEVRTAMISDGGFAVSDLYPNPVKGGVTTLDVTVSNASSTRITVFNNTGQVVLEQNFDLDNGTNKIELNVDGLASGSYFVKVENGDQRSYKKMIIE